MTEHGDHDGAEHAIAITRNRWSRWPKCALTAFEAVKSMSRKGDCWDNAVAESFFATIKGEMIDHEDYLTRAAALAAIGDYIDGFYNPSRRHSAIGYVSPIEFELKFMSEKIEKMAAQSDCPRDRGSSNPHPRGAQKDSRPRTARGLLLFRERHPPIIAGQA